MTYAELTNSGLHSADAMTESIAEPRMTMNGMTNCDGIQVSRFHLVNNKNKKTELTSGVTK